MFVFYFQNRVSVLPCILSSPSIVLAGDERACDEACRESVDKKLLYAYVNMNRVHEGGLTHVTHPHHPCRVAISLDNVAKRTCLLTLRFPASLEKKHWSSSEVKMSFIIAYVDGSLGDKDKQGWRVLNGLERIPEGKSYQDVFKERWGLQG